MAQPPSSRLTLRALISLPYRLCNPPPAVGKVRSCGVTPVLDVRLEDVLARRHLPPIGLKDLEEYLLYVERTPENLYFLLWLKDYTIRYHAWAQREKSSLVSKKDTLTSKTQRQKFPVPPTPDSSLAMFYLRAKQTFFTPNGQYELNIPSDVLAPFHSTPHNHNRSPLWHSQSIHPDPAVFSEVAIEAQSMLNESLSHFVRAAYTNMGSQRAACGIIAGCVFTLVAGVLPLVLTAGRWNEGPRGPLSHLVAFPGLWLGLTILIVSLQGICLMMYFFGDLRQLRKFELARPTISRPIPMSASPPTASPPIASPPTVSMPTRARGRPFPIPSRNAPLPQKSSGGTSSLDSPISFAPSTPYPHFSDTSLPRTSSCESCESVAYSSVECNEIDVSPAFFDDVPAPEGPATASCLYRPEYRLSPPSVTYMEPVHVRPETRPGRGSMSGPAPSVAVDPSQSTRSPQTSPKGEYGPTAGFIPNDYGSSSNLSDLTRSLRSQRSAPYFDFNLLPANKGGGGDSPSSPVAPTNVNVAPLSSVVVDPSSVPTSSPTGIGPFIGRAQYKCNQPTSVFRSPAPHDGAPATVSPSTGSPPRRFWFTPWIPSFTAGVPAFATPFTQVQSQVVKRAQWEVVVRAALIAAVIAGTLTGITVGVVP